MSAAAATSKYIALGVMVLALTLSVALGLLSPYIMVLACLILMGTTLADGSLPAASRAPTSLMLLAVVAALAVCFALAAREPADLRFILNFVMFILAVPLYAALHANRGEASSRIVARLALAGALGSVIVILLMIGFFGGRRSANGLIGVIVLGNTAVLLGFLSLIGIGADRGVWRLLYLLGPIAGVCTVIMTQSRGPLIALVPLGIASAIFMARSVRISWPLVWTGLVLGLAGTAIWVVSLGGRMGRLPGIVLSLLSGDVIQDRTTVSRLDMYQAAYKAFLDSPLFGHGWGRMMEAAKPYLANPRLARLPQLHNDLADFAVAAGSIGVVCYVTLIVGPIVLAARSVRDSQYRFRLFGCIVLSIAYFCDGLTDLMFGFEFHTALYAALLVILLGYCRDREPAA